MRALDQGGIEICLVIDPENRLVGTITDGDLRRAMLGGAGLDDIVDGYLVPDPVTVSPDESRNQVLDLMRARTIGQIPVVDAERRLVGIHVLHEVIGRVERQNIALIMAGGRGKRLAERDYPVPKPMLEVAGRPILERIVLHLVGWGIKRINISVNHQAEVIESHFEDGKEFGCKIDYLREAPDRPLGTAGALGLLAQGGELNDEPVILMNGDLVTDFSVGSLLARHADTGAAVTLGVKEYAHKIPFGVIEQDQQGFFLAQDEKPTMTWPVGAGICVISADLVRNVPVAHADLPDLVRMWAGAGHRVALWEIDSDWMDIGRPDELDRARGHDA